MTRPLYIAAAMASALLVLAEAPARAGDPRAHFHLDEVQATLAVQGLDGWLLIDEGGTNPVAVELVNPGAPTRHAWFYFIPASGDVAALVHADDAGAFAHLGGALTTYRSQAELTTALRALLGSRKLVAAESAPRSKITSLDRVSASTAALLAGLGVELRSSANLVQFTKSLWGPEGRVAHYVAAHHLQALRKQALELVRARLRAGQPVTEYDVQKLIMDGYRVRGITGPPPVVAAGENTADPDYVPTASRHRDIAGGDLLKLSMSAHLVDSPRPIFASVTWMAYVGERVPNRFRDAFAVAVEARQAVVSLLRDRVEHRRPVLGWQAAKAARDVVIAAGMEESYRRRTGHSLDTSLVGDGAHLDDGDARDPRPLVLGSGFTVEPALDVPGVFGVETGIDVFLGRHGVEVTTDEQLAITTLGPIH